MTVQKIFDAHGLKIFDVQELTTHGGSLRIFACHKNCEQYKISSNISNVLDKEIALGMNDLKVYLNFSDKVHQIKYDLLKCLVELKKQNKKIIAYGAAAKGNTLLNYCGIGEEFVDFVVDKNPSKQNTLLPGSRISVYSPKKIDLEKPDYVLILPWNLREEIMAQLDYLRKLGVRFIVPVPKVEIL